MIERELQDVVSVQGSCVISWLSRMKTSVPLSITKAEYIATCSSSCSKSCDEVPERYIGPWTQIYKR